MTRIKRLYVDRHPYFITSVTNGRQRILADNIDLLWEAINSTKDKRPFDLIAWVILPEHIHFLVDTAGQNISDLLRSIKLSFARKYAGRHGIGEAIWQSSFWDHVIRDEDDFYKHLNYIHINPVKHGLVTRAFDNPHSSIKNFKEYYPNDWGVKNEADIEGEFGE